MYKKKEETHFIGLDPLLFVNCAFRTE